MIETEDSSVKFPFDREFQIGILALMVQQHAFLLTALELIKPSYFEDRILIWFHEAICDYYKTYSIQPTVHPVIENELKKGARFGSIKSHEIPEFVIVCKKLSDRVSAEKYLIDEVVRFCRRQEGRKLLLDIAPKMDTATDTEWAEFTDRFTKCSMLGSQMDVGTNYFAEIKERIRIRESGDDRVIMPVGIPALDELLGGGLKAGQLGTWVGGTGRGKSMVLAHCGKRAVVGGYKVLHYTFELNDFEIAERYDSNWSGIDLHELSTSSSKLLTNIEQKARRYGDSLYIKYYPMSSVTIYTLKAHVQLLNSQGWFPDLIILDYLDLLKPTTHYKDEWSDVKAIAKEVNGWAGELKIPIWTASQLNRAGLASETPDLEHMGGAIAKAEIGDVVLFLCATKDERTKNLMRLFVGKNRNGPTGYSVKIKTALNRACFWDPTAAIESQESEFDADDVEEPPTLRRKFPKKKNKE